MLLKNLMEEKQLDFNQPLLSVRRFSSTVASEADNKRKTDNSSARVPPLPAYKSELKSGPIRNPGTVPFVWEQTPGRPKDESRLQTQAVEKPKLPPGRVLKVENQDSDEVPKGTSVTQSGAGSIPSNSSYVTSLDKNVSKPESQKEVVQEKENSSSSDGDDIYQDAPDTLSRTESFFLNCSVSGLSGLDDQQVQSSGCSSTDQQTRDFMIGRFLPAAKAMASETSQFASWKPPIAREQPRQVKKVAGGERSHLLNQPRPKALPHYVQDIFTEESEDEDDEYNRSVNYATKVCGLFPRFCLLNPIPGLRMHERVLNSTVHEMQAKSSASRSETGKEHDRNAYYEKKSVNSRSGFTEERDFVGIPEKSKNSIVTGIDRHRRGFSTSRTLPASEGGHGESNSESPVEKTLYIDSVGMVKSHSGSCSSEAKGQTNLRKDDFQNFPKAINIYKKPSIDPSLEDSKHLGIVDEKATLRTESSDSLDSCIPSCSDQSKNYMQREMTNHSKKIDSEEQGLIKSDSQGSDIEQGSVIISSTKVDESKKIDSESQMAGSQESSDSPVQNSASLRSSKLAGHVEARTQDSNTLASLTVDGGGKIDLERQWQTRLGVQENSNLSSFQLPLALPSPQAPSESWLKRTLLTISSRNISSRAYPLIQAQAQSPETALLNPKWERMVKSSNVDHGRLRFSEELLAPIPEV
ncbi:hypothetical protein L6164_018603 [Bauhinia variegata]|uniref:Uncharacterized protein n=1 Tax=Bauhinia variegata TaxID=167791 RepID=A0ACB9NDR5_BAUVA|nr:hypothetical protein L6164_018603 [Bauhinia variegata]